jgi:serine/threonine protein phosphatase PrpC
MLKIGNALDKGMIRKENQDSLVIAEPPEDLPQRSKLLVVADGMGGYLGGALASKIVVETLEKEYKLSKDLSPEEFLIGSIHAAHYQIRQRAEGNTELTQMGSTVVAVLIEDGTIHIANVGDSRAYLISDGGATQLSKDHSVVAEQVRGGIITEEEASFHPQRNILTMSLNAQRQNIDIYYDTAEAHPGDIILLCSDGLWGAVPLEYIAYVSLEYEVQEAAERLVALANQYGGPDNISVILASYIPS